MMAKTEKQFRRHGMADVLGRDNATGKLFFYEADAILDGLYMIRAKLTQKRAVPKPFGGDLAQPQFQ